MTTESTRADNRFGELRRFLLVALVIVGLGGLGCGGSGGSGGSGDDGGVVDATLLASITKEQLDSELAQLGIPAELSAHFGVDLYKLTYRTRQVDGSVGNASGLVALPHDVAGPLPIVEYNHGTTTVRGDVPSNLANDEGRFVAFLFASAGYAVVAPDYLGLGDSPGLHPFLVSDFEASAGRDMLLASKRFMADNGVHAEPRLFLTGFSEGGHATLALEHSLESGQSTGLTVTAAAPISGAYDLSGTTSQAAFDSPSPATATEISYLLLAYREVYGIFGSLSEAFQQPFDTEIAGLFDGTHDTDAIASALPQRLQDLLEPSFSLNVRMDPEHPLNVALRLNDVFAFRPAAPVRLFHARGDTEVPFENSVVALHSMQVFGADVTLVDLGDKLDHLGSFGPGLVGARQFFDSFGS